MSRNPCPFNCLMELVIQEKWMRGGCSCFGLHTILFVLGGVVVDFGVSSFGFHTGLFFFGGVGMAFGVFSFIICLTFFCLASF